MTTLKRDIENAINNIRKKTNISEDDAFATVDKHVLSKKFTFQGQDIDLVWSCGLFITMNPGLFACFFLNFISIFIFFHFRLCRSYRIAR
jgi:hypothetical protein